MQPGAGLRIEVERCCAKIAKCEEAERVRGYGLCSSMEYEVHSRHTAKSYNPVMEEVVRITSS